MSVYKDKKTGKWFVYICHNRKRYRKKTPDNTRTGAVAYEALLRRRLAQGEPLELKEEKKKASPLFKEFAWKWFDIYVKNNNKISEVKGKRFTLERHLIPFFGKTPLDKITTLDIEQYKAKKINEGLKSKTVNNHLAHLSKCLRTAEDWEELRHIPRIKRLRVEPSKFDFLTHEESELLLRQADGIWHDMIFLGLKTGLRYGELRALKWQDINWETRTLSIKRSLFRSIMVSPKSNKVRHIPLTEELYQFLEQRKKNSGFIFAVTDSQPIEENMPRRALLKICRKAGLRRIGWHVLRHTFASHLAMAGASMKAIQELLGHADIQTTMRYTHLAPSTLGETMQLLDLNSNLRQYNASKGSKFSEIMQNIIELKPEILAKATQKQNPKILLESGGDGGS